MLYHFLYGLHDQISGFNIFRYITFRTAVAVVVALGVFVIFGKPFLSWIADKSGKSIRPDTPERHQQKKGTPSMGGLLVVLAVLAGVLVAGNLGNVNMIVLTLSLIGFAAIGFVDDWIKEVKRDGKGIASRFKFAAQTAIGTALALWLFHGNPNAYHMGSASGHLMKWTEISIPFLSYSHVDLGYFYVPFAVFVMVAASNAVNITDGLDGLAIGLTLFVVLAFTGLAYFSGHKNMADYLKIPYLTQIGEITVFTGALAGACLGFLWFNSHPAQIFMGDTGALALGGVIGTMALLLKMELLLVIIGGVFVGETLSVMIQVSYFKYTRWRTGTGVRLLKRSPLHHHFEEKGWHENKIIIRFWVVGAVLALVGLATLKIR